MSTPSILLKIKEAKQEEVRVLYATGMDKAYQRAATPTLASFEAAIMQPGINLISEFKKASPSKGEIRPGADPVQIAQLYEREGAAAISVLTDAHFQGKLEYLQQISHSVSLPLLRKDFIIDPVQMYEARVHGADAILLITALLDTQQLKEYIGIADSLYMDCLVECHDKAELEKAIEAGASIIGINNRNLHDFSVRRQTTLDLLPYIPEGHIIVTESGILTYEHVKELSHPRINAMLVGEAIMSAEINPTHQDMERKIRELLGKE